MSTLTVPLSIAEPDGPNAERTTLLLGYMMRREILNAKIAELQASLGRGRGRAASAPAAAAQPKPAKKKHTISEEGRLRIAAAQKKRWAAQKRLKARAA